MKLSHGDKGIIDQRKVVDYCLSPDHDDGKHKARLFENLLGLKREHAGWLLDALREAAVSGEAASVEGPGGRVWRFGATYRTDRVPARHDEWIWLASVSRGALP